MAIPILGALIPIFDKVLDRVIPDPAEKAKLTIELAKLADAEALRAHEEMIAQAEINKVEAGHRSLFVAGWRPACGWIGASGLGYSFIIQPLVGSVAALCGYDGVLPSLDMGQLMVLVTGMLGFGTLRTMDKKNGTSNDVLPVFKTTEVSAPPVAPRAAPEKKKGIDLWPF